ncbi:MAG: hypothetical protein GX318_03765 [Clostridia bacterium]|nr:hypothetical protein [Clostridia bacterium]
MPRVFTFFQCYNNIQAIMEYYVIEKEKDTCTDLTLVSAQLRFSLKKEGYFDRVEFSF